MTGTCARTARNAPVRLVAMTCDQSSTERSANGFKAPTAPALLNAMSRAPKVSTAALTATTWVLAIPTSPVTDIARPPRRSISATKLSSRRARRAHTTSCAPSAAKSLAASRPIPELAPVTIATFPSKSPMALVLVPPGAWRLPSRTPHKRPGSCAILAGRAEDEGGATAKSVAMHGEYFGISGVWSRNGVILAIHAQTRELQAGGLTECGPTYQSPEQ